LRVNFGVNEGEVLTNYSKKILISNSIGNFPSVIYPNLKILIIDGCIQLENLPLFKRAIETIKTILTLETFELRTWMQETDPEFNSLCLSIPKALKKLQKLELFFTFQYCFDFREIIQILEKEASLDLRRVVIMYRNGTILRKVNRCFWVLSN
jgi:hypothetical protein